MSFLKRKIPDAEIKAQYEANANSFNDTKNTKLNGIETGATADQTQAEIQALLPSQIAKAKVTFNGTGTVAIYDSYNVSSITDYGVGSYAVNMGSVGTANYCALVVASNSAALPVYANAGLTGPNGNSNTFSAANITATYFRFLLSGSSVAGDADRVYVHIS